VGVEPGSSAALGTAQRSRGRRRALSPWGYLLLTAWATLLATLVEGWWLAGLALLELSFGLLWSQGGLRLLRRPRFWAFLLTAVVLGLFLGEGADLAIGPFQVSRDGLAMGLEMAGRALTITLAFGIGVASLSLSDLVALFDRLRLRGLGFAVGLAMNLLGTLRDMTTATLQTIRLRGGLRRPLVALRLFLITTVANTLRYGDEVMNAAATRAFDPSQGQAARVPLRASDLLAAVLLAGYSLALVALA
jgi:energy-coupling factor transporter transmembrane protein EcfT